MKFLLEILGMTDNCNLRCRYCEWDFRRTYARPLAPQYVKKAENAIIQLRQLVDDHFPDLVMVEYSGGEPFLYPEIIHALIDCFGDKWVRIVSNGLLIEKRHLPLLSRHGRAFLALSIDGCRPDANSWRFGKREEYTTQLLRTLDNVVEAGIPVMVLCTLHAQNIDSFPSLVNFMEERYKNEVSAGRLVMPAHCVTAYSMEKWHQIPAKQQSEEFCTFIMTEGEAHPLIARILPHYEQLAYYLSVRHRYVPCTIYNWLLSIHYLGDNIIGAQRFHSFGCGMRGVEPHGNSYTLEEDRNEFVARSQPGCVTTFSRPLTTPGICRSGCFVDWVVFDLILQGRMSLPQAAEWFVMFQERRVHEFITAYQEQLSATAYP